MIRSSTPRPSTKMLNFGSRGLALVAVPWPWVVALKLVHYAKQDLTGCTTASGLSPRKVASAGRPRCVVVFSLTVQP